LLADGLRRRWEPDVRDAGGGDVIDLGHQEVVPTAIMLPRLPVETLSQNQNSFRTRSQVNL
jgi:hypothetical protein